MQLMTQNKAILLLLQFSDIIEKTIIMLHMNNIVRKKKELEPKDCGVDKRETLIENNVPTEMSRLWQVWLPLFSRAP